MITCTLRDQKYSIDFVSGRALRELEPAAQMYAKVVCLSELAAKGQPIPDGLGRLRRPGQQKSKSRQASPGRQLSLHIPHLHGHCMRPGGGTCKFFRRRA